MCTWRSSSTTSCRPARGMPACRGRGLEVQQQAAHAVPEGTQAYLLKSLDVSQFERVIL